MDRVCFGSPIEYWLKSAVILRMFKPNRNLQTRKLTFPGNPSVDNFDVLLRGRDTAAAGLIEQLLFLRFESAALVLPAGFQANITTFPHKRHAFILYQLQSHEVVSRIFFVLGLSVCGLCEVKCGLLFPVLRKSKGPLRGILLAHRRNTCKGLLAAELVIEPLLVNAQTHVVLELRQFQSKSKCLR
jgi:hypothetical protein